jgi:hypothetical protein
MEAWGTPYKDILAMPTTRRYRLILRKSELEREREKKL